MNFDYNSAKARILKELGDLVKQLWPEVKPVYEEYKWRIPGNKANAIVRHTGRIKDEQKRKKFLMLYELRQECYWHATDFWPEIRRNLTREDESFYTTLIIEQAKRGHEQGRLGYAWIVKSHDNGNLRDFISEDLLREAVNIGFWEFANEYLTDRVGRLPEKYYNALMRYYKFLDLSRVNELKVKPILISGWVDARYIDAFERARKKVDIESGSYLARPIIEQTIFWVLSLRPPRDNPKTDLARELEPYKEYLATNIIQELLKERVRYYIRYIKGDDAYYFLEFTKILTKYLNLSKSKLRGFISSSLPRDEYRLEETLVELDFPKEWINSKTMSWIQSKIIEHLDEPTPKWRKEEKIIPHLSFLQDAVQKGWLNGDIGKKRINSNLETYLIRKRRPAGATVVALLDTLSPELVEEEVYKTVIHQGITDLVKRNKIEKASIWYKKAEEEGWLDKSKVPVFELKFPTEEKKKTEPKTYQLQLF